MATSGVLSSVIGAIISEAKYATEGTREFRCKLFTDTTSLLSEQCATLNIVYHYTRDVARVSDRDTLLFTLHRCLSRDNSAGIQLYNGRHIGDIYEDDDTVTADLSQSFKTILSQQASNQFNFILVNNGETYATFTIPSNVPLANADLFRVKFSKTIDLKTKVIILSVALKKFIGAHARVDRTPDAAARLRLAVAPSVPRNELDKVSRLGDAVTITPRTTGPLSVYTADHSLNPGSAQALKIYVASQEDGTSTAHFLDQQDNAVFKVEHLANTGHQCIRVTMRSDNQLLGEIRNNMVVDATGNPLMILRSQPNPNGTRYMTFTLEVESENNAVVASIVPTNTARAMITISPTANQLHRVMSLACAIKVIIEIYRWYRPTVTGNFPQLDRPARR